MKELDCRGLTCPQPVIYTKQALEKMKNGRILVIVDNEAARNNVTRFARSQDFHVDVKQEGSNYLLVIDKTGNPVASSTEPKPEFGPNLPLTTPSQEKVSLVVKISNQFMGQGPKELGRVLIKAFFKSLADATIKPKAMVFYNSGVHLVAEGSEHLKDLHALEELGTKILVCGTCLDYFGFKEKLGVGQVSNMFEIIETLSGADRVVSP